MMNEKLLVWMKKTKTALNQSLLESMTERLFLLSQMGVVHGHEVHHILSILIRKEVRWCHRPKHKFFDDCFFQLF